MPGGELPGDAQTAHMRALVDEFRSRVMQEAEVLVGALQTSFGNAAAPLGSTEHPGAASRVALELPVVLRNDSNEMRPSLTCKTFKTGVSPARKERRLDSKATNLSYPHLSPSASHETRGRPIVRTSHNLSGGSDLNRPSTPQTTPQNSQDVAERGTCRRKSPKRSKSSFLNLRWHYMQQQRARWSRLDESGEMHEYSMAENLRIEDAFWRGKDRVRVRSGGTGSAPSELWLSEMIQFNPESNEKVQIARSPPAPMWLRLHRRVLALSRGTRQTFAQFERMHNQRICRFQKARSHAGIYKYGGCCATVMRSAILSNVFSCMVLLNAVWLGFATDLQTQSSTEPPPAHVQAIDYFFAAFFAVEIAIRFFALRRKGEALRSPSFLLDAFLVLTDLCELVLLPAAVMLFALGSESSEQLSPLSSFRLARLLRTARLGRLMQVLRRVPEVLILLRGILKAFRSLAAALMLELLLLYMFGLVFRTFVPEGTELARLYFSGVLPSMGTLLMSGIFLDSPKQLLLHEQMTPALMAAFIVFVFLGCFLLLNVLVGTICQVIADVSKEQREELDVEFLCQSALDIVECFADSSGGVLHQDDVGLVLRNPEMRLVLDRFGVDVQGLRMAIAGHLSEREFVSCSVEEFLELILRCRRSNVASVADLMQLRTFLQRLTCSDTPTSDSMMEEFSELNVFGLRASS